MSDTYIGATVAISNSALTGTVDQTAFETATYTDIAKVGNLGDTGTSQALQTYNVWGEGYSTKALGFAEGNEAALEFLFVDGDPGQEGVDAAAGDGANWGFKITHPDGSIEYILAIVTLPSEGRGAGDSFRTKTYTLGIQQETVYVAPPP